MRSCGFAWNGNKLPWNDAAHLEMKRIAFLEMHWSALNEIHLMIIMPTRKIRVGISRRQSRHFNLAKQEFQSPKVNFIANNLRLFARFLYGNGNSNSHTNHGVVTCTDQAHHFDVKKPYVQLFLKYLGKTHHPCEVSHTLYTKTHQMSSIY